MDENALAEKVIGAAIEVHRALGPGMLESTYQRCLAHELGLRLMTFKREVDVGITYKGLSIEKAYRSDFIVEEKLVVELKAVERIENSHKAQLLTYLRWSGCKLGLLINFNAPLLKHGIHRLVNQL